MLRKTASLPPLQEYLMHRFGWDVGVLKSLDWEVLRAISSSYDAQRPTLVKHFHAIAPTGKYAHRNDRHESQHCPACTHDVETNDHLFYCTARSRQEWRIQTCERLSKTILEEPCDMTLGAILVVGLQRCFRNGDDALPPMLYPARYGNVINEQNAIGWIQLFRGRWTTSWKACQSQWYRSNGIPNADQLATKWVHRAGRLLLDQWWKLWKLRNTERHGRDETNQE